MPKNKRGNTDLNFLIGINKPAGMTSHDVVNKIRNITGEGRVGHMGTLDPFATGVLLIGVGSAARLNSYLENHDKTYIATIDFGKNTNTYDIEGEVTQTFDIDDRIYDKDFTNEYLAKIVGKQMQVPPAYSAIKINGKAAYKSARKGNSPKLEPREIEIFSAKLISIHDNSWDISLEVSKGTYIRSIAYDIGKDLGCGAYLSKLSRAAIANVSIDDCYDLEQFEARFSDNSYKVINCAELLGMPIVQADEDMLKRIKNGRSLGMNANWNMFPGSKIAVCDEKLLAIYRADSLIDLNCETKFSKAIEINR